MGDYTLLFWLTKLLVVITRGSLRHFPISSVTLMPHSVTDSVKILRVNIPGTAMQHANSVFLIMCPFVNHVYLGLISFERSRTFLWRTYLKYKLPSETKYTPCMPVYTCREKMYAGVKNYPPAVTLPSVLSAVCIAQN